ncbi:hypothetical protein O4J56_11710 [Nocardiopsis sp. RSe5-2]|uniref:Uncharacterized protein n=1 Tax=Nocardiopsis endophytica TaxID=3018445 RepID=A0ABT4U2W9_9ACTN|nr:hypothetical protein [Nocardiopsis endophytica]MDA2811299.1 hypothetical protein [Nocardiopsis endophytica]
MGLFGRRGDEDDRRRLAEDREHADRLPELMEAVAEAEAALVAAHGEGLGVEELNRLGKALDTALTDAVRAAYAQERVLVGERGYSDRIYRRKRLARPEVRVATERAERLLTARERHRLQGVERVPRRPAGV